MSRLRENVGQTSPTRGVLKTRTIITQRGIALLKDALLQSLKTPAEKTAGGYRPRVPDEEDADRFTTALAPGWANTRSELADRNDIIASTTMTVNHNDHDGIASEQTTSGDKAFTNIEALTVGRHSQPILSSRRHSATEVAL